MTDHPMNQSVANALVSLSTALATMTREVQRTRGFSEALEARIAALEAKANARPAVPTAAEFLAGRGGELTTFERATRSIRDGQW